MHPVSGMEFDNSKLFSKTVEWKLMTTGLAARFNSLAESYSISMLLTVSTPNGYLRSPPTKFYNSLGEVPVIISGKIVSAHHTMAVFIFAHLFASI